MASRCRQIIMTVMSISRMSLDENDDHIPIPLAFLFNNVSLQFLEEAFWIKYYIECHFLERNVRTKYFNGKYRNMIRFQFCS